MYYKGQIQKCVIMLSNTCILKEDNNDYYLFYTQKLLGSSTRALHIFSCFKLHFEVKGNVFIIAVWKMKKLKLRKVKDLILSQ